MRTRFPVVAGVVALVAVGLLPPAVSVGASTTATRTDFDGNGTSDVAVFRPSTGGWFVQGGLSTTWGTTGDIAVPGDYNGDGRTDVTLYRPSDQTWLVQPSGSFPAGLTTQWGIAGDIPVPADFNGDGTTDIAVYRPSDQTWYVQPSGSFPAGLSTQWGVTGDVPVPGDFDGDGDDEVAVYRPSDQTWYSQGSALATQWGVSGDIPIPADFDGDGDDDVAVYRPSDQTWYVQGGLATQWGVPGDMAVPADYTGDGNVDVAVYRPSDQTWYVQGGLATQWGTTGDIPVVIPPATRTLYTEAQAAPVVSGINPTEGSTVGGEPVTITGTGFTGTTQVSFGDAAAASFTIDNDTTITAVTPPAAEGQVDVIVTTPAGSSTASQASQYTYTAPATGACDINWTGTAGNNSWHTPTNWDLNRIPTHSDEVCIGIDTGTAAVAIAAPAEASRLVATRPVRLTSTLTISGGESVLAGLVFEAGSVAGPGSVRLTGAGQWSGGHFKTDAVLASGSSMQVLGNCGGIDNGAEFLNQGQLTLGLVNETSNHGAICMTGESSLVNEGTLTLGHLSWVERSSPVVGEPRVVNRGSIVALGSTTSRTIQTYFDNAGQVQVQTGTLEVWRGNTAGQSDTGTYTIAAGATLSFRGGARRLESGAPANNGGVLKISGANVAFPVGESVLAGLVFEAGSVAGPGSVRLTGAGQWSGGHFKTDAVLASGSSMQVLGNCGGIDNGAEFLNQGQLTLGLVNETSNHGAICMTGESSLVNEGTLTLGHLSWVERSSPVVGEPRVVNRGSIVALGSTTSRTIQTYFDNAGQVQVQTGTLEVWRGNNAGQSDTGTYTIAAGATLSLQGPRRLAEGSSVSGSGKVVLSGDIQVDGAGITAGELQLSNLLVRFRGVMPGSGYPVFQSTGLTSFSGSVRLQAEPGWCPSNGDSLTPFRFGSYSGNPSIQVTDAEFTATQVWLADRVRFDISNVDCDVTPPTISGFTIDAPSPADQLLKRGLDINASDNRGVTGYEYVWRFGLWQGTQTTGTGPVRSTSASNPIVSFADSDPHETWTLFVRAVDRKQNKSVWSSQTFTTPDRPTLIALGDSIASGHNSPQGGVKECKDINYSYARSVFETMQQSLPASWRDRSWTPGATLAFYDQYVNLAYSGFSTAQVIEGGVDACDTAYEPPLTRAVNLLAQPDDTRSRTWNSVLVNVGIDDTNWVSILTNMSTAPPPFSCSWVSEWDLESRAAQMRQNSSAIYRALISADSGVRITRTGGYNMGGTGPLNRWPNCVSQIQPGVDQFDAIVFDKSLLTTAERAHVFNQPIQSLLNARDDRLQTFNTGNFTTGAWPHPNPDGHQAIASLIHIRYTP